MNFRCPVHIILFLLPFTVSVAQNNDSARFESEYQRILNLMQADRDSLSFLLNSLSNGRHLSEIQRSKLNYLKTKIFAMGVEGNPQDDNFQPVFDSAKNTSLLDEAVSRIVQSRTAIGIPMLLEYLKSAPPGSDSSVYARIYLAEGYRKIAEYKMGIEVLYDILKMDGISPENRAFAYNRLAALYDECNSKMVENRYDSVVKYSELCIRLSTDNNLYYHLATAQNELGYYYTSRKEYAKAMELYRKAYNNCIKAGQIPDAMNARNNIARIFYEQGQFPEAIEILLQAEKAGKESVGTNIFVKIYLNLAKNYYATGKIKTAYEYIEIARKMQVDSYRANITANIYDMTAKYESEKKEKENLQLRMENEINELKISSKNRIIDYLITGILFIGVLSVIIIFLYFQKKKALDILVRRNLEIVDNEKEFGIISEQVAELTKSEISKPGNTIIRTGDITDLKEPLENLMRNDKPYLYSDISINDISQKLNTNRTYISKLINDQYHKNFNDFINEYRIKTARQLLADPAKNHISIEGIGQMSGFNSRSTFFTCFKKYTGISPSYFRESIK